MAMGQQLLWSPCHALCYVVATVVVFRNKDGHHCGQLSHEFKKNFLKDFLKCMCNMHIYINIMAIRYHDIKLCFCPERVLWSSWWACQDSKVPAYFLRRPRVSLLRQLVTLRGKVMSPLNQKEACSLLVTEASSGLPQLRTFSYSAKPLHPQSRPCQGTQGDETLTQTYGAHSDSAAS